IGVYKQLKLTKPILIIDNEKSARFLITIFKKAGIKALAKDTKHLADVIQAFEFLKKQEIDYLFIDSLSKVYYQFVKDYKIKNRKERMYLNDWGAVIPAWQEEFCDKFLEVEGNISFTGRGGFEYEKEGDELDEEGRIVHKGQMVKSGVKMKIAGETPFDPDLNVWMQLEKELDKKGRPVQKNVGYVFKDRSRTIMGKRFEFPTYKNFKSLVDFIVELPIGKVAGETFTNNLTPGNDYDYFDKRNKQQIETEIISGIFDKYGLGDARSKADKQIKATIIEKIFGTTSQTEISKMNHELLKKKRSELEELFSQLSTAQPENVIEWVMSYHIKAAA
ncbi:MAG: hypothetical protein P8X47_13245, partial [Ignavibacteriaceae bacterium]